ncbi:CAT2-like protein [Mya arenaria]|uniref:CAT2-like protein n=1 Tax=Mya arenaria TaxID=6604 RepID=A0ABY7EWT8_MYAAR|nr:CAT2-like protein [Mya arenaria]
MSLRNLSRVLQGSCRRPLWKSVERGYYLYSPEPIHPLPDRTPDWKTAEEAVQVIQSGQRVFIHGAAATPVHLIQAMCDHGKRADIRDVEVMHIHTEGPGLEGRADAIPIFLSEIPRLFRQRIINIDVALVSVSPPDKHGFCSLGTSVDCTRSAIQNAKYIIAQVNKNLPRTFGDGIIHQSHVDAMVECDDTLHEMKRVELSKEEVMIGKLVAENLVLVPYQMQFWPSWVTIET